MITAGPTKEFIDPVRYITNASSGKMGYALAVAAAAQGANVKLISGPVNLPPPSSANISVIYTHTAKEMYERSLEEFKHADIAIFSAAVADYTPKIVADKKIKKQGAEMSINLVKTRDIAAELGKLKKEGQLTIGFALETDNELKNARKKLKSKNFDMVVLNSLQDRGAGFGGDTNKVTIIDADQEIEFTLKPKEEVAKDIIEKIAAKLS
jgi:phosphopantothenoylcysteine decarboxylase/phosphopantothenate--cysteine ligase